MKEGFTLIELLVVVLIIGILAAIALPQYEIAVEKSRAAEPLAVLKNLREAQELYYMANGTYATDLAELDITVPESKYFNYTWSGMSVAAYSKKKPYLLAYRDAQHMAAGLRALCAGRTRGPIRPTLNLPAKSAPRWELRFLRAGGQTPAGRLFNSRF